MIHWDSIVLAAGIAALAATMPTRTVAATVIDNGQAGYSESGSGWQNSAHGGYGGSSRYHLAGSGNEKASWQLSSLAAGTYNIQATWGTWSNRASNSPYRIYDGATLLQTVRVNQQQAPNGSSINGYPFQALTTVQITSGTLTITLADDANGLVSADAVAISTTAVSQPTLLRLELVTNNALVNNDGDNEWGGHKPRIIRMSNGDIYTAYSTATAGGIYHNQWNLAKRTGPATWTVVATGMAGREPVNLLRGPQDQIYLVSWDGGLPSLTTSTDGMSFTTQSIPGSWPQSDVPYHGAGISPAGDLYVLQSDGTEKPGKLYVGYRMVADGQWHFTTINTDYRYCYAYLFPTSNKQLQIQGQRDVKWSTLGWTQPTGSFAYVFDGLRQFRTSDITSQPFSSTLVVEEVPTAPGQSVATLHRDVYVDSSGNMHVFYIKWGPDVDGMDAHSAIVDSNGTIVKDLFAGKITGQPGERFMQSPSDGSYYVINNTGLVYPAGTDGTQLGTPIQLNMGGYNAFGPNGLFLAAPRGGTQLSNIWDGVFASGSGEKWVYVRIQLP